MTNATCPVCEAGALVPATGEQTITFCGKPLRITGLHFARCTNCGEELVPPDKALENDLLFARARWEAAYTVDPPGHTHWIVMAVVVAGLLVNLYMWLGGVTSRPGINAFVAGMCLMGCYIGALFRFEKWNRLRRARKWFDKMRAASHEK